MVFGRYAVAGVAGERPPDHLSTAPAAAINIRYLNEKGTRFERTHTFEGIIPTSNAVTGESDSMPCARNWRSTSATGPARLRRHPPAHRSAHVRVGDKTLHEISRLPLGEARNFFNCLG